MEVPKFISNTKDDLHCVQACVGMALSYLLPQQNFSMKYLEEFTGFVKGKVTWEMEELLNYEKIGIDVKAITHVSYEEFAQRGLKYLEEVEGLEVAQWSAEHTNDIALEQKRSTRVAEKNIQEHRIPTKTDIIHLLNTGWLVMLSVNSRKLNGKPGFFGHRILIYKADDDGVTMHDPGLPPHAARKVNWLLLENAWADPNDETKMLIAVRNRA